ncbi:MAG: hypothetical protein PW843_15245 [Azospirillaceae bacterium]|nr:hypothetical protein [Azospirillaceae bacterium]
MAISKRFPADHHGPLLPPPGLAQAWATNPGAQLADLADEAVVGVLKQQRDSWISVVTDGELRRRPGTAPDVVAEARFLTGHTDLAAKIRVPREAGRGGEPGAIVAPGILPALLDLSVRYIQLDGAAYGPLIHQAGRQALLAQGVDPDRRLEGLLDRDRAALRGVEDVTGVKVAVCLHDVADLTAAPFQQGLDFVAAEKVLHGLAADRFLFDCGRDADDDFAFLGLAPAHVDLVLGLIDGQATHLPDPDELVARIDAAAAVVDTDRLSLSPRHGLYPVAGQDPAAGWARQKAVFDLLLDGASRAWGIDF